MKRIILIVSVLSAIALFFYLPGLKIIWASGSIINGSLWTKGHEKDIAAFSESEKLRDFKIPNTYTSEDTPYDTSENSSNIDIHGNADPTKKVPWKGPKLVVIDPGHGGSDPGANVKGLLEKDIGLDISSRVDSILKSSGIPTYMTRTDDSTVDVMDRINAANEKNAALFVSIHSNWFNDSSLNGTMTLYCASDSLCAGNLTEIEYAQIIQGELMKVLETKDRGIINRPNLAVLRHANMPSVIVELGFLSNKGDAGLLASDNFRQKAAEAIAEGISKALIKISIE